MPASLGIGRGERRKLADLLNRAFANTYVLCTKIQRVHWNVQRPLFYAIHWMTEEQCEDLAASIDTIAERVRALGYLTPTSLAQILEISEIAEVGEHLEMREMLKTLSLDHQAVSKGLHEAVREGERTKDVFTVEMLTERIGRHEHFAWMLRALAGDETR